MAVTLVTVKVNVPPSFTALDSRITLPSPLKVKEVSIGSKRYIVCLNEDQATKDRADREAIVCSLREALKRGDKSLIGN